MLPFKARIGEIEDKKTGKKVHACRCRSRRKEEAEGGGRQTGDMESPRRGNSLRQLKVPQPLKRPDRRLVGNHCSI